MKVLSKLILVLIIVFPIIICVSTLNKVWDEEELEKTNNNFTNNSLVSGEQIIIIDDEYNEPSGVSGETEGEKNNSVNWIPTSKLYTDATIAITVANVYEEARETSVVLGTLEKYDVITAQKYPQGWTRVTTNKLSGWMRTENITFTDGGDLDVNIKERTGKIKAEPHLNVRASASATADIITTIPDKTIITIQDEKNGWYKVTYASATGWVKADYVIEQ